MGIRIGNETLNPKKLENQEIVNRLDLVQSREREKQKKVMYDTFYKRIQGEFQKKLSPFENDIQSITICQDKIVIKVVVKPVTVEGW